MKRLPFSSLCVGFSFSTGENGGKRKVYKGIKAGVTGVIN